MIRYHTISVEDKELLYGPGKRVVLWVQGCSIHCVGCLNPHLWNPKIGYEISTDDLATRCNAEGIEGITLLGGEPIEQAENLLPAINAIKANGKSVILFTGYEAEELISPPQHELYALSDIVICGRFDKNQINHYLHFRGSDNQRVLFPTERYKEYQLQEGQNTVILSIDNEGHIKGKGIPDGVMRGIITDNLEVNSAKHGIDETIRTMFPRLLFHGSEYADFTEHLYTKGLYLYKQVYESVCNWKEREGSIPYSEISGYVRYDKGIRDKLYIYLSAAEEFLRSEMFNQFDIEKKPKDPTTMLVANDDLTSKASLADSNLYFASFSKHFSLEKLVRLIKGKNIYQGDKKDLGAIVKLRNKVMHHALLLLSFYTDPKRIKTEVANVERYIEALYKVLPVKVMKNGLEKAINKSNYKDGDITVQPYSAEMRLRRFQDGIFN
jgi:anaerobic ribonucleoside-triphosphate reductase activating protein